MDTLETVTYKGFSIDIVSDVSPLNPFEEWDCLPCLLVAGDRYATAYNDSNNYLNYLPELTREEIKANINTIKEIMGFKSFRQFWCNGARGYFPHCSNFVEVINDFLQIEYNDKSDSERWSMLAEVLEIKGIQYYQTSVCGYVQGAYCDVIAIADNDYLERTGLSPNHRLTEGLEGACELYGFWAFGDVYGYVIPEIEESCWGFYGDDHNKSGLLEYAKNAIDCHIKYERRKRLNKLKELIKNHVPLTIRPRILSEV